MKIVKKLSIEEALQLQNSIVEVYRSVFTLPPYNSSEEKIDKFAKSWESLVRKEGFEIVAAFVNNEMVGFSSGWKSIPGDYWYEKFKIALGDGSQLWLEDCFEFVELAVKPSAQGLGLGRDLTKEIFKNVNAKTALLLTHSSGTKASEMYVRNGWIVLNNNFVTSSGQIFQIMGKKLN